MKTGNAIVTDSYGIASTLVDEGFGPNGGTTIQVQRRRSEDIDREYKSTGSIDPYRYWTVNAHTGYFVGGVTDELVVDYNLTQWGAIERWLGEQLAAIKTDDDFNQGACEIADLTIYLGSWKNDETGHVHLDRSVWVGDLDEALALAKTQNQLSIWDCKNAEAIWLSADVEEEVAA